MGSGYCPIERLSYIVGRALCLLPQKGKVFVRQRENLMRVPGGALAFYLQKYIFVDKYFLRFTFIDITIFIYL